MTTIISKMITTIFQPFMKSKLSLKNVTYFQLAFECISLILFIPYRYELWMQISHRWRYYIPLSKHPKIKYVHNNKIAESGISLKYLIELVRKFSVENNTSNPTMYDLVNQWIKHKTFSNNESYLEFLCREQPDLIATTADYFVSYVWSYPLKELVEALEYELLTKQNKQDIFIWIDSVCLNQHIDEKIPPFQLQDTFGESLKAI
jgi:hypothetical protein